MTEFDANKYVQMQREEWGRVANKWEKWDAFLEACYKQFNEHLLNKAGIAAGHRVLDLGSGTGYPAVVAAQRVGRTGSVDGVDLAPEMLAVAARKAASLGLQNIRLHNHDISSLPFESDTFDSAISRFCLMFLPHLKQTLGEVDRVLKPGARFAPAVWASPQKNPLPMTVLTPLLDLPPIDLSLPGPYHLGSPGDLAGQMQGAGFTEVEEEEVLVEEVFSSGHEYAQRVFEMAAPLQAAFRKLDAHKASEVLAKLAEAAEQHRSGGQVYIPRIAWVVCGKKPLK